VVIIYVVLLHFHFGWNGWIKTVWCVLLKYLLWDFSRVVYFSACLHAALLYPAYIYTYRGCCQLSTEHLWRRVLYSFHLNSFDILVVVDVCCHRSCRYCPAVADTAVGLFVHKVTNIYIVLIVDISGIACEIFTKCLVHVAYDCGAVVLRHRWDTLCSSGFVDDIMFFAVIGRIAVWILLRRTDYT